MKLCTATWLLTRLRLETEHSTTRLDATATKCNASDASQRWSWNNETLQQGGSGLCLGVVPPTPPRSDHCETRVTLLPCGDSAAVRWRKLPGAAGAQSASSVQLVNALNHQPLNLYESPLDPGRFHREVQTCAPPRPVRNNLWTLGHGGSIESRAGGCLGTGMVTVTPTPAPAVVSSTQVYSKLLNDGSTAVLLLNRADNHSANVSANLGRCLMAGYVEGGEVSVTNLRDGSTLPSCVCHLHRCTHLLTLLTLVQRITGAAVSQGLRARWWARTTTSCSS